jgi:hypothetical protein
MLNLCSWMLVRSFVSSLHNWFALSGHFHFHRPCIGSQTRMIAWLKLLFEEDSHKDCACYFKLSISAFEAIVAHGSVLRHALLSTAMETFENLFWGSAVSSVWGQQMRHHRAKCLSVPSRLQYFVTYDTQWHLLWSNDFRKQQTGSGSEPNLCLNAPQCSSWELMTHSCYGLEFVMHEAAAFQTSFHSFCTLFAASPASSKDAVAEIVATHAFDFPR